MSSRPPCTFTSRAWAFSMTIRPLASCHLACTGTITGKRLPRRWSVLGGGGGVIRSSMEGTPEEQRSASSVLVQRENLKSCSTHYHGEWRGGRRDESATSLAGASPSTCKLTSLKVIPPR